jgi:hypothetical protein
VLAAGEEEGHLWLSRGVHRCSGSEMVSLSVPRLLLHSKEPRRSKIEVIGAPRRHRRSGHVAQLQARLISFTLRPNPLPFRSFHPPGTIMPESCMNHRDQRESLRRGHRQRGGAEPEIFLCTVPSETLSGRLTKQFAVPRSPIFI